MSRKNKFVLKRVILYAVLVIIAVVAVFPLFYIVLASFRTDEEIFRYAFPFSSKTLFPVQWTLENYKIIFTQFSFWRPILNTCLVVLILVPLNLIIASVAAFAFAFFDFKGKNALFAIFIVSFMIPTDAIALPLYSMIAEMGIVNTISALILPSVSSGLAMFLFTQFFKGIPKDFLEAGRIDGASWAQIFFQIIIPLSIPVFITAGLMIFVNEWNNYLWPLLVTRSEEVRTIQVALAYFKDENETFWSYIYAASAISAIVPVLVFLPLQKYFVEGVTSGGIKG